MWSEAELARRRYSIKPTHRTQRIFIRRKKVNPALLQFSIVTGDLKKGSCRKFHSYIMRKDLGISLHIPCYSRLCLLDFNLSLFFLHQHLEIN